MLILEIDPNILTANEMFVDMYFHFVKCTHVWSCDFDILSVLGVTLYVILKLFQKL